MSQLLSIIQKNLEHVYEVSVTQNVRDYVITDKKLAGILTNKLIEDDIQEQLLISTSEDSLDISLYLSPKLIKRIGNSYPTEYTNKNNLHDFWIALEGVSHFLYLVWNATYDRPVSQLELELQAEIDKFVSTTAVLGAGNNETFTQEIWSLLFSQAKFKANLEQEHLQRYQTANLYASKYCFNLMQKQNFGNQSLQNELRRFYRLKQNEKLSRIDNLSSHSNH